MTFDYGTTTAYGTSVTATQSPSGGSPAAASFTIGGLTAGTLYHYRVNGASVGGTTHGGDLTFSTPAAAPSVTVSAIAPSSGPAAGGTAVTITGTGFSGVTGVTIGGVAATSVVTVSTTSITAVTGAGTAGPADVVVSTGGGSGTGAALYSYGSAAQIPLSLDAGGNFTYNASNSTGADTTFSIDTTTPGGPYLVINDPNNTVGAGPGMTQVDPNTVLVPLASITGNFVINGSPLADTFTMDFTNGDFTPLPPGMLTVNGGLPNTSPGDSMAFIGTIQDGTYDTGGTGSGSVDLGLNSPINFTGLEPLDFSGMTFVNFTVNVDAGNAIAGNLITTVASADAGVNTQVSFTLPPLSAPTSSGLESVKLGVVSGSLTINGGNGDNNYFQLQSLGSAVAGDFNVAGQGGNADVVEINNTTFTVPGNFTATADFIGIGRTNATPSNPGILSCGGNMTLTANGDNSITTPPLWGTSGVWGTSLPAEFGTSNNSFTVRGAILVRGGIQKTGGADATLTLTANASIGVTNVGASLAGVISSTSGRLNVVIDADADSVNGGAVQLQAFSSITSNGGDITIGGGANPSVSPAIGLTGATFGVQVLSSTVNSGGGNISIRGQGAAASNGFGVFVNTSSSTVASLISSGAGSLAIVGVGGATSSGTAPGVELMSTTLLSVGVSSTTGPISISGTATSSSVPSNGIMLGATSSVSATGAGSITLTGKGAGTLSTTNGLGIYSLPLTSTTANVSSAGGNITLVGDTMNLAGGAGTTAVSSTGGLTVKQLTAGRNIDLGAADSSTLLGLSQTELNNLTAPTLTIGDASSGTINLSAVIAPTTFTTLALASNTTIGAGGGFTSAIGSATSYPNITVTGTVSINASAALNLSATGGFVPAAGQFFTLIHNDGTDPVTGSFASYAEGATLSNFLGSGLAEQVTYLGGDGNDLTIGVAPTVAASTASFGPTATTITITGTGFDTTTLANNTVTFNDGSVGTVTAATATSLTVTFNTSPTIPGGLTAVVTTDGISSGAPVEVGVLVPTFALGSATASEGNLSGSDSVTITVAPQSATWVAVANDSWLHSTASGAGNASVAFSFDANTGVSPRTGTLTIGGQTLTVTQAGTELPSLVVTIATDVVDSSDNQTSLREAVAYAASLGGSQTVTFAPALSGQTITLSTVGDPTAGPSAFGITQNLTVDAGGNQITIARNPAVTMRLFYVAPGASLTLLNLTVQNFLHKGGDAAFGGGGAGLGGAIFNNGGTLVVTGSTFAGNTAQGGASISAGGTNGGGGGLDGIYANNNNNGGGPNGGTAPGGSGGFGGGGAANFGGAGAVGGFGGGGGTGNPGGAGGFGGGGARGSGNGQAGAAGGFAGGHGATPNGAACTGGGGGGLGGAIFSNGGSVTLTNSTFSGNSAAGGAPNPTGLGATSGLGLGGAVFSRDATLTLDNCTLSGNTAADGGRQLYSLGDGGHSGGDPIAGSTAATTLNNSILGQSDTAVTDFAGSAINGGTSNTAGAGNLIRTQSGFSGTVAATADPLLSALASNGGPTQTMAPAGGSPAVNAGSNALASALTTDQRGTGYPRVGGTTVDIGAYELAGPTVTPSTATLSITTTNLTITGTGFDPVAVNNTVAFNDGALGHVAGATTTSLNVNFDTQPTAAGALTAVVTTTVGSSGAAVQVATVSASTSVAGNGNVVYTSAYDSTGTGADAAPNTGGFGTTVGTWDSVRSGMVISSSGAIAFRGHLIESGAINADNYQGIWKSPDGTPHNTYLLAQTGSLAPEAGTDVFDQLPVNPYINNLGQTSFVGYLRSSATVNSSNMGGVWSELGTGSSGGLPVLRLMLRQGDALGADTVTEVAPTALIACSQPATTSATAYAAFTVQLNGGSATPGSAVLRVASTPASVAPVVLAREGAAAPGPGGVFDSFAGNASDPRMDAAGDVAFLGYLQAGGGGIWYQSVAGSLGSVAYIGQTVPGGGDTFTGFERPSLAATSGQIAFRAFMNTTGQSVWKGSPAVPSGLTAIAKSGDTGLAGIPGGSKLWSVWSPFSNAGGKVAFRVTLLDGGGTETRAIVTDTSGTLTVIAKVGDAVPGYAGETFTNMDHPVIGDGNQAAFPASTSGGHSGIWRQAANGGALNPVLMVGDTITTNGVTKHIAAFIVVGTASSDRLNEVTSVNAAGQILVYVTYDDGATSILLTSP